MPLLQNLSVLCASIQVQVGVVTAFRSIPSTFRGRRANAGWKTKFIELAGEINRHMPEYIIKRLQYALNERGKSVKGSRLMIIGLAYKKDINDDRESPAYRIISLLMPMGAKILYHDPFIPQMKHVRQWLVGPELKSQPLTNKNNRCPGRYSDNHRPYSS